ncbi:probable trehalose-phosphate phosphatase C [Ricinus communis]|nr:probable trehalose-phosphate phosphatase C [Ricinus communis]XP_025012123.1 probable trehalose-phosphate phosphatase C [Ricinus communis]XP_025012124.1 probable trehalose-phosphate phosphatase C [Ricinus communis]XP_048228468.1 probable trehalose-phosphate phosphatase C [Ricinus communis]XP_048228469.1 probable trehalose-phosphate phosphatase C [Ricinus communis]|eukprot:XP_002513579.2 probable trehalose-phosphate phosphatase C [Ricinus communis]
MFKKNIAKLNQAMCFQRCSSNKQKSQSGDNIKKASNRITGGCSPRDANYNSWVVEHPSALSLFDQMMKAAKGKKIVVFLDYDGTLSPIVDNPDLAFMSDEMRAAVREVAKYFPTAIISGRSRDKVKEFVKLSNVYYAGSHGMDIMAPPRPVKSCDGKYNTITLNKKGNEVLFQPAKKFLPAMQKILTALKEKVKKIQGARVEDNRFCVSVHFRQVREEDYGKLEEKVKSVLEHYPEFHLNWGKKVMEIRPSIEWDKGHALEYLLDTLGLSNSNDVLPVYIGDDRTDEDAFQVIQRRGQGFPIIVTSSPKDTKASYSLSNPSEVLTFLLRLARWRKSSTSSRSLTQIWGVGN